MKEVCPQCESAIVAIENAPGSFFCSGCGYVCEEGSLSTEVTFGESSSGAATLQGTVVNNNETRARTSSGRGGPGRRAMSGESHEQTLANGRRRIGEIANQLNLNEHIREMAVRYFNLAVNNNFVRGRRSNYVVASCLYIACRMNKTNHMLIDFSATLQVNVFVLGNTFLRLVQSLSLSHKIPHVDPSLYIQRFAALLDFGDDTPRVAADATQLVTRFRDDWMVQGRRPAGICGACLLLAARMNNFRRSITEIIQVVKIADVTVKKRLDEFKATPAGQLTVQDFRAVAPSMTDAADPPAFTRVMLKEKIERERQAAIAAAAAGTSSSTSIKGDIQVNPDDPTTFTATISSNMAMPTSESKKRKLENGQVDEDDEDEEELAEPVRLDYIDQSILDPELEKEVGEVLNSKIGADLTAQVEEEAREKENRYRTENNQKQKRVRFDEEITNGENIGETKMTLEGAAPGTATTDTGGEGAPGKEKQDEEDGNRLDNLDEDALDQMLMNDDEVLIKTHIWMNDNREFLERVAARKLKEEAGEGDAASKRRTRNRKKRQPRDSSTAAGETAADSARSMFKKKKISKKINYDVLSDLLNDESARKKSMDSIPESIWPLDQRPSTSIKKNDDEDDEENIIEEETDMHVNAPSSHSGSTQQPQQDTNAYDDDDEDDEEEGEGAQYGRFNRIDANEDDWEGEEV